MNVKTLEYVSKYPPCTPPPTNEENLRPCLLLSSRERWSCVFRNIPSPKHRWNKFSISSRHSKKKKWGPRWGSRPRQGLGSLDAQGQGLGSLAGIRGMEKTKKRNNNNNNNNNNNTRNNHNHNNKSNNNKIGWTPLLGSGACSRGQVDRSIQ